MNCEQSEQAFAAAIEGTLDGDASDRLASHLADCPSCRAAFDETCRLISILKADAQETPESPMAAAVAGRIIREQSLKLKRNASMKLRIVQLAAAAALLASIGLLASPLMRLERRAYADDLKPVRSGMEAIKSASWEQSYYMRFLGPAGKGSKWVRVANNDQRYFYKSPGRYRRETLNEGGEVNFIAIEDIANRALLEINPGRKSTTLRYLAESSYSPSGPFATYIEAMKAENLQGLGAREIGGKTANGFRYKFFAEGANQPWSYEFWIDPAAERLVAGQVPGGDIFDPTDIVPGRAWDPTMTAIEVDGVRYELATELGVGNSSSLVREISTDIQLDDAIFRAETPEGYRAETIELPPITEVDVAEFLGILARYFGGKFPDRALDFAHGPEYSRFEKIEQAVLANKEGAAEAEVALVVAMHKWWRTGIPGPGPLNVFATQMVEKGSWKYLGDGIRLGDKERIICWFRPNGSKSYRVIYGDLSIKDAAERNLPLPPGR